MYIVLLPLNRVEAPKDVTFWFRVVPLVFSILKNRHDY
jgi:hypothetical protein